MSTSMSTGQTFDSGARRLCLHPSVGTWVDSVRMSPREKVAAVAKVRCLEHGLFDGDRLRRDMTPDQADETLAEINEIRCALGWQAVELHSTSDGVGS